MRPFLEILEKRRGAEWKAPHRLLVLDPGETTGWCLYIDGKLHDQGQASTYALGWHEIHELFEQTRPTMVLYENYRVYQHKLERHSNSEVYTIRLIGVIEYLCEVVWGIKHYNQMAHQAKGFVTDEKLKAWGYYVTGKRHARDAIRHGCYFLLFNKEL